MKYHGVAGLIGLTPVLGWLTFLLESPTFISAKGSISSTPLDPEFGLFWFSSSFSRFSKRFWHFSRFSVRSPTDAISSAISFFFSRFFEIHSQILECSLTKVFVLYWHSFAFASSRLTRVSNSSHMARRSRNIFRIWSPEILTFLKDWILRKKTHFVPILFLVWKFLYVDIWIWIYGFCLVWEVLWIQKCGSMSTINITFFNLLLLFL